MYLLLIQKCKKCSKEFESTVSKFCSFECAYSYSDLDKENYLMLRLT